MVQPVFSILISTFEDGDMKAKVLLVDDEVEFVSTLAERLCLREYDVQYVSQIEDALDIVRSNPPDVILLDFRMPQMDGVEVLKIIKQMNPLIEVIMLAGYGDDLLIEKAINSGAFQYIMKPVDITMLTEKIDKANEKAKHYCFNDSMKRAHEQ